jgi:hypothetical protein
MIIDGIEITLKRKKIKHMYLRVLPPNGEVTLSAPISLSDEELIRFIRSKKEWILKKQEYIKENDIRPPIKYNNGETHYLWGKEYTLQLISNKNVKHVLIDEDKSVMYLPIAKRTSFNKRKKTMNEFYRSQMEMNLPPVLDKCTKIVGRKPKEVKIRSMKNWGNCKQDGRITLNLNLAKKDPICLEYVTLHELCHLIEFNHGKNFKKLMDKFCPNWKKIKKILNE